MSNTPASSLRAAAHPAKAIGGMTVFAAAGGACSAALGGLLLARRFGPAWSLRLANRWSRSGIDVTAGWAQGFRLAQFITYLLAVGLAAASAFAWMLSWKLVVSRTSSRVGALLSLAAAIGVTVWALATNWGLGLLAGLALIVSTWLATETTHPAKPWSHHHSQGVGLVAVLSEALALSWGLWLAVAPSGASFLVPMVFLVTVLGAVFFAGRSRNGPRLTRVAIGCVPMLLLPILGLFRGPSVAWVVVAALLSVGLAVSIRPRSLLSGTPSALLVPALWSVTAIAIIPLSMREAKSINAASHEAFHLGWVNSALHGRWLGADAGLTYGILREYLITGFCCVFGATAEHVRMSHVLLNLIGVIVFLISLHSLFARRPALLVFLWYLGLFYTPLRNFCDFDLRIAFGWADSLRMFGATGVVIATCLILAKDADRVGESPGRHPRYKMLVGCGALTGLLLFYSQEYGLCAIGASGLATMAAYLLQGRGLTAVQRVRLMVQSGGSILVGVAIPVCAVLCLYGSFGKAGLLVTSTWKTLSLTASGAFGSLEFPISAKSFENPGEMFAGFFSRTDKMHEPTIQFMVPVAIYLIALCALIVQVTSGRWRQRSTILFGMVALGMSSFRVPLARAGIDHLISATAPAVFCLGILLDQSIDGCIDFYEEVKCSLGFVLAGAIVIVSVVATERISGLGRQFDQVTNGTKEPSGGVAYSYPDLPRAGDVYVDGDFQALARFVRSSTAPTDKMFALLYMMDGGELYFLCDRANPTRYDLLAEIMTGEQQHEVLESLKADPPRVIIGDDGTLVGEEVLSYVRQRWTVRKTIGRYTVWLQPDPKPS